MKEALLVSMIRLMMGEGFWMGSIVWGHEESILAVRRGFPLVMWSLSTSGMMSLHVRVHTEDSRPWELYSLVCSYSGDHVVGAPHPFGPHPESGNSVPPQIFPLGPQRQAALHPLAPTCQIL